MSVDFAWTRLVPILADHANGRVYATVLRPSVAVIVCRLRRYVLWLNGAYILQQKLLLTAWKSYMSNRLVLKWMTSTFV